MSTKVIESNWVGASEDWFTVSIRLPKQYVVELYGGYEKLECDLEEICANGHTTTYLYGFGRKLRDGAQQLYAKDKKGKCIETEEGKAAKGLTHAENRYEELCTGEIKTRVSSKVSDPYIVNLKSEVIKFAHNTLKMTMKAIGKLPETEAGIVEYCETLKGCPVEQIKANAKALTEMMKGFTYEVEPEEVEDSDSDGDEDSEEEVNS
jgi:hypothetical protein